jgi:hypothetical protein
MAIHNDFLPLSSHSRGAVAPSKASINPPNPQQKPLAKQQLDRLVALERMELVRFALHRRARAHPTTHEPAPHLGQTNHNIGHSGSHTAGMEVRLQRSLQDLLSTE